MGEVAIVSYALNEAFMSLQGEGIMAGSTAVFLRFAGCNLSCSFCDTDHSPSFEASASRLIDCIKSMWPSRHAQPFVILTGGEPMLQVDTALLEDMRASGFYLAVETNGTIQVPSLVQWVTVSPKAGLPLAQHRASEVKYVMQYGDPLPTPQLDADYYLLSPIHYGRTIDARALKWCISLCMANPQWRLSTQAHKVWNVQ